MPRCPLVPPSMVLGAVLRFSCTNKNDSNAHMLRHPPKYSAWSAGALSTCSTFLLGRVKKEL